ncbi:MAG: FeoB-associated Cys-rich membrane protein [Wujia sp.]
MIQTGTIFVLLILLTVVTLIVRSMLKAKAAGKSTCGCDCGHCGGACHCSMQQDTDRN